MPQDIRHRIRFLKHEAKEAGDTKMHQLCCRALNGNLRLHHADTRELVQLDDEEPITPYVQAIGSSLDCTESRPGGVTTYRGLSVVALTYQWSTAS